MDKSELERQYSPSRWSKRFDAKGVLESHVKIATEASNEAKNEIPYESFRYGRGENQIIDIFGTSLPEDSPLLVYIHGGFWQELCRNISSYLVKPFHNNGIRVAVAGYDLAPKVSLEQIIQEIHELRLFINDFTAKKKSKAVWYCGHSAGAHLIATLLNPEKGENNKIQGMTFISGVYDLTPLVDTYVNDALNLTRERADELSIKVPDGLINGLNPSFLIVVAENDSDEFRRQSQEFYSLMQKKFSRVEFLFLEKLDHFDIVEKLNDENYELTRKMIQLIKCKE